MTRSTFRKIGEHVYEVRVANFLLGVVSRRGSLPSMQLWEAADPDGNEVGRSYSTRGLAAEALKRVPVAVTYETCAAAWCADCGCEVSEWDPDDDPLCLSCVEARDEAAVDYAVSLAEARAEGLDR